jgi:hypothetical protein
MRPEFLALLVSNLPNSYELGETIRKFYFFYKDNSSTMTTEELETTFIKTYIKKEINFQKIG